MSVLFKIKADKFKSIYEGYINRPITIPKFQGQA